MIIDVMSFKGMEESLAEYLSINEDELIDVLMTTKRKVIYDLGYYDSGIVEENLKKIINGNRKNHIDEVYICHLCRQIEKVEFLLPLNKVLTTKNSLSNYLKEKKIEFIENEDKIEIYYEGRLIEVDNSQSTLLENNLGRLKSRLGYSSIDYCINGFAYAAKIKYIDNYYSDTLTKAPEIFIDLQQLLKIDLITDFLLRSQPFMYILRVPFSQINLDIGYNCCIETESEKETEYLIKCLMTLLDYYEERYSRNTHMLRLNDSQCIKVYKTIDYNYFIHQKE